MSAAHPLQDTQLALTEATWSRLVELGVRDDDRLRMEFLYWAPDRTRAAALREALLAGTGYQVELESSGPFFRKRWTVQGVTGDTAVSREALVEWTARMVEAGLSHGCTFDGWGTSVPKPR